MGKNKEGLSNLTAYNKQHNKPKIDNTNSLVMSQHTSILQKERKHHKKKLIPFEQELQARDIDQIKAHLKLSVGQFQWGCIKVYLHKWKELTSDMEVIDTALGMPINITSDHPVINKYQYPFND